MGNLKGDSNIQSVFYDNSFKKQLGLTDEEYVNKVNNGEYSEKKFVYDGIGFGLAQWTYYTRKKALYDMCRGNIGDMKCQVKYLLAELKTYFGKLYPELKTLTDVRKCALKVFYDFGNYAMGVNPKKRIEYANDYYNNFE